MMRIFTVLAISFLCLHQLSAQCQYQLVLEDAAGNGWAGAQVSVFLNGTSTLYTLNDTTDNGKRKEIFLDVKTNDSLRLTWVTTVSSAEATLSLYDAEGQKLYQKTNPAAGILFVNKAICPTCAKPSGVYLENIYALTAKARWNAAPNALKYRVIYGPKGFNASEGDTIFSNTPKATLVGLSEFTNYDYYVNTICSGSDTSLAAGPFSFRTYWSDDLAVTGIDFATANCDLGAEIPSFKLSNKGSNPQTLFNYYFSVNGVNGGVVPPMDGLYTGVVGKDSTVTILFETQYNFSNSGEYEVCVFINLLDTGLEDDSTNNRLCKRFTHALGLPYAQTFEDWDGGWEAKNAISTIPATSWQYGEPAGKVITKASSSNKAWVTNLTGNHANSETSYLTSPCFDLSALTSTDIPALTASINYNLDLAKDGVWLEMSTNGGSSWQKVGAIGSGLNWYNSTIQSNQTAWSGNSNGWIPTRTLLPGAQGQSAVQVRFVFSSDSTSALEGFGVDQLTIALPRESDLAALGATTSAEGTECGAATDSVRITVANFGQNAQPSYQIRYAVNNAAPVTQTINQSLAAGAARIHTFSSPFNSTSGNFDIKVSVILGVDQFLANNEFSYSIDHSSNTLPFVHNFEDGLISEGWKASKDYTITDARGNISHVLSFNLDPSATTATYVSTAYGLVNANDSLTFDYRMVDYLNANPFPLITNTLRTEVSANCGTTWVTIDLVDSSNHIPTTELTRRSIKLSAYVGQNIKFRFTGSRTSGDWYLDLDNIGIRASSVSIDETAQFGLVRAYPNPTTDQLQIEGTLEKSAHLTYTVFNLMGAQVLRVEADAAGTFTQVLDLRDLPAGLYFTRISDGVNQHTLRVVKQ
jgi:Secretion system C-terminal sorting domain